MIETMPSEGVAAVTHVLPFAGLCPVSGNPQPGSRLVLRYVPAGRVLEVFSLLREVDGYRGGRGEVRTMEAMVSALTASCAQALGVPVSLRARVLLQREGSALILRCHAQP